MFTPAIIRRVSLISSQMMLLVLASLSFTFIVGLPTANALSAPTISSIKPGNSYLEVAFSSVASAAQYQYSVDGGLSFTTRPRTAENIIQTWSPMTIHGLENDRTYSVVIRALDGAGNPGTSSSTVNATPRPQTRNLGTTEAVLQGAYAEVGMRSSGSFGTTLAIGSNFHEFANSPNCLGFRVDRQKNGWGNVSSNAGTLKVGSTFVNIDDGDYFCPGTPYEGWSLKVGANTHTYNNHNTGQISGSVGSVVLGSDSQSVFWGSSSSSNGIKVEQVASVPNQGQSLHIDVTLTNTSAGTLSNIYYGRGFDPDNATGVAAGNDNDYSSTNTIVSVGGGSSAAVIRSTFASGAQIFLRSNDTRARVAQERSFDGSINPSDVWNAPAGNFSRTTTVSGDNGVGLAIKIDSLAAGASTTFRISYVLTEADASTPTVTTGSATGVGPTDSATLNASVNPNGSATTVTFEYSTYSDLSAASTIQAAESPLNGSATLSASATLSGLSPGTTYYFRVKASNSTGDATGSIRSFTPIADPTVQIEAANGIGENSATLNGFINPNGGTVGSIFFTIDSQSDFNSGSARTIPGTPTSISGTTLTGVSASVGSLLGAVTYYFKLSATNEASTRESTSLNFTTTPAPLVTTGSATSGDIGARTIVLNGTVNTYGTATGSLYFELSKSATFTAGSSSFLTPAPAFIDAGSTGAIALTSTVLNVDIGDTYYYRLFAGNTSGTNYGTSRSFTLKTSPTVATGSASTSGTTATLSGTVNPNGAATSTIRFYYSTTAASIGSSTAYVTASPSSATGNTTQSFSGTVSGLTAGSTYFYRIMATNSEGTSYGSTESFTLAAADTTSPQPVIIAPGTGTSTSSITVTVEFDEPTSSFSSARLLLSGSSGGWAKGAATASGSAYTIVLTPSASTGAGNLVLNINAGAAQDTSGNLSLAASPVTITISSSGGGASSYSITYLVGSASSGGAPSSGTYTSGGTAYTILGNTGSLARAGYTVNGWNTQPGGGGTSYFAGSTYSTDSNLNLYPRLVANTYTITYLAGSATGGAVPSAGTYTTGSTPYTILGNTGSLERTFCTFAGWNSQPGGGGANYFAGSTYATSADLSLYPLWTGCTTLPGSPTDLVATATGENTATVSFSAPGSDGGMTITSYTFTSTPGSITATLSGASSGTVTFTGLLPGTSYTFVGYATNNNGNSSNSVSSNSITTLSVGLTPTFDTPVPSQGGFTVNITNYNLNYAWNVSVSGGYSVELGSGGVITVTGINNTGYEAVVTVTTTRSGYSSKSASVTGASRNASPEVNLRETSAPTISVSGTEVTCICGDYRYVSRGWIERTADIQAVVYVLYLDGRASSVVEYDPKNLLAAWLAPNVESSDILATTTPSLARFNVKRDYKSAQCEILMFESPTLHLAKTPTYTR